MRSAEDVRRVFELWEQGLAKAAIARATGVSRAQVRHWLTDGIESVLGSPMRTPGAGSACDGRCDLVHTVDPASYAYLFGQYLGDGCISEGRRHVFKLRITMCDAYPGIRDECEAAIRIVMPGRSVLRIQREGCTEAYCCSKHWPCLFPQHGPGRKHERPLLLCPWQERIVFELHPELFLRGLIHSDGCRAINRITARRKTGTKRYAYPRYFFVNESDHIRGFFVEACNRLGVEWRYNLRNSISVARRASVEILDSFVGPKR